MNRDLTDYRKSYNKGYLNEDEISDAPLSIFSDWFKVAEEDEAIDEANAMTLGTIGLDGFPKTRIVLLKHYDDKGFVFYTNYTSEKGEAISHNGRVCISFFWPSLERQVIIQGIAEKISDEQSTAYYKLRPRGSQLGAWVSDQSAVIDSRAVLEEKLQILETRYQGKSIPKPDFWGGFRVKPVSFEFWQGRENRLHDRIRYTPTSDSSWKIDRLSP
ncbi:pyridoxamine 5'-phosphate oxidase [Aquimarina intermedia]|uniref:Pyridoxine/pyridoxamine 5'-phosphate oxidase n=1 Tax=Aquimarina intermedia TaxID=350814 RepID=A0A5S5C6U4_9FLAO|nr:pyridoxamine 5'-phosphate oxidase [Aquimarina intermedia]TYP75074.1 pyridoxamine 5'-phosphate oxidase [Aquimarina intermedia]